MRRLVVLIVSSAAMLVAAPTASSQPAAVEPTNVRATLVGTTFGGGTTCCIRSRFFEGTGSVPMLGTVSFVGFWSEGSVQFSDPVLRHQSLELHLVSRTGGTIVLQGITQWLASEPMPPLTWSVVSATGRFAALTGSGTYTIEAVDGQVVVRLSGTLLRA